MTKNLEDKIQLKREVILNFIKLMQDRTLTRELRNSYHDRCLIVLQNYSGKDYDDLVDKYLKAEWTK